jgi:hypothetical protein
VIDTGNHEKLSKDEKLSRLRQVSERLMHGDDRLAQATEKVEQVYVTATGETYLLVPGWVSDTEMNDDLRIEVSNKGKLLLYTRYPGEAGWVTHGAFDSYEALADYVLNLE